ncbi:MAG: sulfatase [Gemmatimonadetes bacterium]|nr:sulfatase [Gemmatimonadota bacterium]
MFAGIFWGTIVCLVEVVLRLLAGRSFLTPAMIPGIILLYVVYWALVGVTFTIASRLAFLRALRPNGIVPALAIGFTLHAVLIRHLFSELVPPGSTILWVLCYGAAIPLGIALGRGIGDFPRGRHTLVVLSCGLALAFGSYFMAGIVKAPGRPGVTDRQNVFILMIDTLRKDHVGVYGYPRNVTPHLDRLARDARIFDRAYSTSSWTHPAIASLFTSQYPSSHGVETKVSSLTGRFETLAESFEREGYRTGIFSASAFVPEIYGLDQGFQHEVSMGKPAYEKLLITEYFGRTAGKIPLLPWRGRDLITLFEEKCRPALLKDWLTTPRLGDGFRRWVDRIGDENFFAYVHVREPHAPYVGRGNYAPPGPVDFTYGASGGTLYPFDTATPVPGDSLRLRIDKYDDDIWAVDRTIGDLFYWMEERGLFENTIVIVTADHGEEFYEHRSWKHGTSLFEELVAIPLFVHVPGAAPARSRDYVSMIDIAPTLLDLAGIAIPEAYRGHSFAPLLRGDPRFEPRSEIFAELARAPGAEAQMLLVDGEKVIQYWKPSREVVELYDLGEDPGEQSTMIARDSIRANALLQKLRDTIEEARLIRGSTDDVELDPNLEKQLRAMGYLE